MAMRLTTSFVNTNLPSAPVEIKVLSNPIGIGNTGIVAIIGEAVGGDRFDDEENIKANYYTPDQTASVIAKYTSGPIVDAMVGLSSPSADTNIPGTTNRIYILKTNKGTKATSTIASYGALSSKNFGTDSNRYSYTIDQSVDEETPVHLGTAPLLMGANLTSKTFGVRVSGGAVTAINVFTGVVAEYDTEAEVLSLLNGALTSLGITATLVAVTGGNALQLEMNADSSANSRGFGKSIELIAGASDALAPLKLTAGLYTSAYEPQIQLSVNRLDNNTNESFVVGGEIVLKVGYKGDTATLTTDGDNITTVVTGGLGASFTAPVTQFVTLQELMNWINNLEGYIADVDPEFFNLPIACLDQATFNICASGTDLMPGRIKKDLYAFDQLVNTSMAVDFVASAVKGLPAEQLKTYLTSGTIGGSSNTNVYDALLALENIDVNFVVPLFSRNATDDIIDGLTQSSSTYSIDSINALVRSHVLKVSDPKYKKNRQAFCSKWSDVDNAFSVIKNAAGALAHPRMNFCFQKPQMSTTGDSTVFMPWFASVIAAGMQAGGFYKALIKKYANVLSYIDPNGFDSNNHGDKSTALDAGLLFLESINGSSRWVSDQTTYGFDSNFVYNSIQAMFMADTLALDLSNSLDNAFGGQSLADVNAASVLSFIASKMDIYRKMKMIAPSDDAPAGYKNTTVKITAPIMEVQTEVKLATAIYFIPVTVFVSQITNSASQSQL